MLFEVLFIICFPTVSASGIVLAILLHISLPLLLIYFHFLRKITVSLHNINITKGMLHELLFINLIFSPNTSLRC